MAFERTLEQEFWNYGDCILGFLIVDKREFVLRLKTSYFLNVLTKRIFIVLKTQKQHLTIY